MSLKKDLAKKITDVEKEIQELEGKLMRSMTALVDALVSKREPPEKDLHFFRKYTSEIEFKRAKLIDMVERLKYM